MNYNMSIVIPVYNKINFTKQCLEDLKHLPLTTEIIIVDNGSSDGTLELINKMQETMENLVYIRKESRLGFAKACNLGYQESSAPNVMFLNNDIKVLNNKDSWINPIIEKCSEGLVGPTMGELSKDLNFVREVDEFIDSDYAYLSGWCLSSSKEIFNQFIEEVSEFKGPFTEKFNTYFEDTNMGFEAKKLGVKICIIEIPVKHYGKITTSQLNTASLYIEAKKKFQKLWKNKI